MTDDQTDAAVEMPAPWKPQTGFHRALEISPRARDSHISTSRLQSCAKKSTKTTRAAPGGRSLDRRR
jgi:hypothetical protein